MHLRVPWVRILLSPPCCGVYAPGGRPPACKAGALRARGVRASHTPPFLFDFLQGCSFCLSDRHSLHSLCRPPNLEVFNVKQSTGRKSLWVLHQEVPGGPIFACLPFRSVILHFLCENAMLFMSQKSRGSTSNQFFTCSIDRPSGRTIFNLHRTHRSIPHFFANIKIMFLRRSEHAAPKLMPSCFLRFPAWSILILRRLYNLISSQFHLRLHHRSQISELYQWMIFLNSLSLIVMLWFEYWRNGAM